MMKFIVSGLNNGKGGSRNRKAHNQIAVDSILQFFKSSLIILVFSTITLYKKAH